MATYINPNAVKDGSLSKSKLDTALVNEINGKQEALTLTVKDNGNIVLANIQGQSKEFMPATPSGDPMHYAYVAAGAEYNDTGADIVKTGMYGDTIIHKAGYWYLGELGDISTDEIREIYVKSNHLTNQISCATALTDTTIRTNFPICNIKYTGSYIFGSTGFPGIDIRGILQHNRLIEVFNFRNHFREEIGVIEQFQNIAYIQCAFINCEKLKKNTRHIKFIWFSGQRDYLQNI